MAKSGKIVYYGTGRRKSSIARVRLVEGSGKITVNGKDLDEFFGLETLKVIVRQPLTVTNTVDKYDVTCTVTGGGFTGQAGAIRLGITRALLKYDETYDYVPEELKNYFDGEVSILILDKKVREKGIGKKLLTDIFTLAKRDGLENLQIFTDVSCSYYIYEATGCKRVFETTIKSKEYSETRKVCEEKAYIYEKKL